MVENLGPKNKDVDESAYLSEKHMRNVLDVILNQSATKLGMQNGKGRTYEGILTVKSISIAQKYYELLKKIKNGQDELKISEDIQKRYRIFLSLQLHTQFQKMKKHLLLIRIR